MKERRYWTATIIILAFLLAINMLGKSKTFCDWYANNLFVFCTNFVVAFSGLFSFSVGEIVILLFVIWVIFLLIVNIINISKNMHIVKILNKTTIHFILFILIVMTLNLSLLYGTSKLEVENDKYDIKKLVILRNYILNKCNELSMEVERDNNGLIILPEDMQESIISTYQSYANSYTRLKGRYSKAKPMMGSIFMYHTNTMGVYFPHSMEAMYNKYISMSSTPFTIAHEIAHLKGYIYEDEANYFAYLICISSDEVQIKYSGYLGVLNYINNDLYLEYLKLDSNLDYSEWLGNVRANELVKNDNVCYDEIVIENLSKKNEVVEKLSSELSKQYYDFYNSKMNYSDVTLHLLNYYDGILY